MGSTSPGVGFEEIVDLVKQDVALSLKLLRYVNSLAHGVRRQIDSVKQAAIRLGLQKICQIVTLIAMGELADKPKPLVEIALIRARMCETLGTIHFPEHADVYFTVGLFSSLDAFLDRPLPEILTELPITTEMREAILSFKGPLGRILSSVIAFERGLFESVSQSGIDDAVIQNAYLEALVWGHVKSNLAFSNSTSTG